MDFFNSAKNDFDIILGGKKVECEINEKKYPL